VITGGGTGGHIYPALEVGRLCADRGWQLIYLGSHRGQEGKICEARGIAFKGFPSEPLFSLKTPRGIKAAINLFRASNMARSTLQEIKPLAVFSTGGYSSAPVVRAAKMLGIPYVLHEANSIPGRSISMFAQGAKAVAVTFKRSEKEFPGCNVVRTGMPVRQELRALALNPKPAIQNPVCFVFGGSQGAGFLNEHMPNIAKVMADDSIDWLHSTGPTQIESVKREVSVLGLKHYTCEPYLQGAAMGQAYQYATVVICRSGGSLAELAVFGLPSVLVPLPSAAANHQYHNAKEFSDMGAAIVQTEDQFEPNGFAASIREWIASSDRREKARVALKSWDIPDATQRIVTLIEEASGGVR
jgi:UDP-N-acetylglucosamine--N-acetylmuramyl-(pentapeptide) pyrophosphoryl-undecaprenol N-acetylglucosamine transferase